MTRPESPETKRRRRPDEVAAFFDEFLEEQLTGLILDPCNDPPEFKEFMQMVAQDDKPTI
jgi:hypothetical protein